jgi:hypothetical protein
VTETTKNNVERDSNTTSVFITFGLAGPPIGLAVVLLVFVASGLWAGNISLFGLVGGGLLFVLSGYIIVAWIVAYAIGLLPAVLAGYVVNQYVARHKKLPFWVGATTGLLSGLVSGIGYSALRGLGLLGSQIATSSELFNALWGCVSLCVIVSLVCTHLVRDDLSKLQTRA